MPASRRRQAAHLRAAYTGETAPLAAPGLSDRHGNAGLDACTAPQRRLRALLALGLFNYGPDSTWPRETSLADVTRYTLVLSPRPDDLVITAQAPYNVLCWLVARDRLPDLGLPGLRVETCHEEGWRLRHLPTGATMTIASDHHGRLGPLRNDSNWMNLWTTQQPVTPEEHAVLAALPQPGPDTETVLAALAMRLCARDPNGTWDIGMWFYDTTDRPLRDNSHHRRLHAETGHCELHWSSTPYPDDLSTALTHPYIGLADASVRTTTGGWQLHYGTAHLTAHPHAYRRHVAACDCQTTH